MAKLAPKDERSFSPIAHKLLDEVSGPTRSSNTVLGVTGELRSLSAISRIDEQETRDDSSRSVETVERLTRQMRYGATPGEEKETKDFIRRLSSATGLSLTHSNLMRSCRDLLFQVEDKLIDEIRRANLKRPINDKHAIARFESRMMDIIRTAIRQSPLPYSRSIDDQ